VLNVGEMAKLMGHDVANLHATCSDVALRKMLGMSVHKGTMGIALLGLLASLSGPGEQ